MKWSNQLILSKLSSEKCVCVDLDVSNDLSVHHLPGIRFLYQSFQRYRKGVLLNHDPGMNYPLQVAAFLNAVKPSVALEGPVLVICSEENVKTWHYHLTIHGKFVVTLLSQENLQEVVEGKTHQIILSHINDKVLREVKHLNYFCIVVDELDRVVTKNCVKGYDCKFKIGLTHKNFLKEPDNKLIWSMLNWCEVKTIGKLTTFCSEYEDYVKNFLFPYQDFWHRLTWGYCDSFKRDLKKEEEYRKKIQNWRLQDVGSCEQKIGRKRKIKADNSNSSNGKISRSGSDETKSPSKPTVKELETSPTTSLASRNGNKSKTGCDNRTVNSNQHDFTSTKAEVLTDYDCLSMLYGEEKTEGMCIENTCFNENNIGQNSSFITENSELSLLFGD